MRKPNILYEDLRSKNRENYEVTLTQKAEAQLKTPAAREPERSAPQKAGELWHPEGIETNMIENNNNNKDRMLG